jgi:dTDP-4-dehydrorhamnose 3,5-epimerase
MEFAETTLPGAFLVSLKKIKDDRGYFARGFCRDELQAHGLVADMLQLNVASSLKRGTLRGMHFQARPHQEAKFVRCTQGALFDVIIDLRKDSPTRLRWFGAELTRDNGQMLYVPEGFAHGYQTLVDDTEMYYLTTATYAASAASGVRHDDPAFGIDWPLPVSVISEADRRWPDYSISISERL